MMMTKTPPTAGIDDGAVNEEIDPAVPAKRRTFSAEQKRQILAEYEATAEPGAKGALLRRAALARTVSESQELALYGTGPQDTSGNHRILSWRSGTHTPEAMCR